MDAWTKKLADAPLGAFAAEAAGLDWIRVDGGPPVPRVHDVTSSILRMDRIAAAEPTAALAEDFGHRLAILHSAGAVAFGAPWTGFIGPVDDLLPMDNEPSPCWADHFRDRRVHQFSSWRSSVGRLSHPMRTTSCACCIGSKIWYRRSPLPYLDRVLGAYNATTPLADGWRDRVPIYQLWPLLVHAALFGPSYGARAGRAARAVL